MEERGAILLLCPGHHTRDTIFYQLLNKKFNNIGDIEAGLPADYWRNISGYYIKTI
jgi:hypothetical protein